MDGKWVRPGDTPIGYESKQGGVTACVGTGVPVYKEEQRAHVLHGIAGRF